MCVARDVEENGRALVTVGREKEGMDATFLRLDVQIPLLHESLTFQQRNVDMASLLTNGTIVKILNYADKVVMIQKVIQDNWTTVETSPMSVPYQQR